MSKKQCEHRWVNDPLFTSESVIMMTNDNPDKTLDEEIRQYCTRCDDVRYVRKERLV